MNKRKFFARKLKCEWLLIERKINVWFSFTYDLTIQQQQKKNLRKTITSNFISLFFVINASATTQIFVGGCIRQETFEFLKYYYWVVIKILLNNFSLPEKVLAVMMKHLKKTLTSNILFSFMVGNQKENIYLFLIKVFFTYF